MRARWLISFTLALGAVTAHAQDTTPADPATDPGLTSPAEPATEPVSDPMLTPDPAEATAPEASAEVTGGESIELTEAELAELGLAGAGDAPPVDTSLKIYGFMDFNVSATVNKRSSPWRGAINRHPAFYMGSFNLYLSKNLTESIRTFGEVRFTYLPAGQGVAGSRTGEYVTTAAPDYADYFRAARWGGIEIERVYLEWAMFQHLTLRVGQFLTPYGIWNVDHGSPTIITFSRPFAIGQAFFPERQTGFELLGRYQASGHNAIGYHLTLSNGTGALSEFRDFDRNKAVGGRLYWDNDAFGELRIGASIYYGKDTTSTESPGLGGDGKVVYAQLIKTQADTLALAADIQWKYGGFHIQGEYIAQQRRYTDKGRVGAVSDALGTFIAPADDTHWGIYGLVGYRFDWIGVMPYFMYQHLNFVDVVNRMSNMLLNGITAGLNIRPIESVVLKIEYLTARYPNGYILSDDPIHMVQSQLAWAF